MKKGEINSLFKNLSKVIKNPKTDLTYKNILIVTERSTLLNKDS